MRARVDLQRSGMNTFTRPLPHYTRAVFRKVSSLKSGRLFGTVPGAVDGIVPVTGFEWPTESRLDSSRAVLRSVANWFVRSFVGFCLWRYGDASFVGRAV